MLPICPHGLHAELQGVGAVGREVTGPHLPAAAWAFPALVLAVLCQAELREDLTPALLCWSAPPKKLWFQ